MKYKLILLLLCMAGCLLFFTAGCGDARQAGQTENTTAASQSAATSPSQSDVTGPSQNAAPSEEETTPVAAKQYMPDPGVYVGVYRDGLGDVQYDVTGKSIKIGGPIDYIVMVFNSSIVSNNLSYLITLDGYKNLNFDNSGGLQTVRINLALDRGTKTSLKISKDITNAAGRCLMDDIYIDIDVLAQGAQAQYKLIGTEADYDLGKYMDESIELPSGDKNFAISFSKAVDRKSVEDSIGQTLSKQNISYSLNWLDDTDLTLHAAGLKPSSDNEGGYGYTINVEDAVDIDGNQVCSNLNFIADKPNSLGYIDLANRKPVVLHEFNDLLFMAYKNYSMDKYLVVHNPYMRQIIDLGEGKVVRDFIDDKVQFDGQNTDWLDGNTLFSYDRENNVIYRHTLNDDVSTAINLPFVGTGEEFMMMRVSPDGQKIAILYNWWQPSDLYIISTYGKLLYKYDDIANLRPLKSYEWVPGMAWLDNDHIAIEDGGTDENPNFDIVKLNIENGEKETYIKDAVTPVTLPGKDMALALKYDANNPDSGDYIIVSGVKEVGTIKRNPNNSENPDSLSNFLFTDNDHLVFNRNDDLVLVTISSRNEELLGKGTIVGSSMDRGRIYFMTNYVGLYTYY